ncbi:MAG: hypothetical protein VYC91_08130 [Acidobacteriota bacterium]|nr:hypothetical protein [Acidobacteriota bacterium]
MKQEIGKVKGARIQTGKLIVQHERDPGGRVPDAFPEGAEHPSQIVPGHALFDSGVVPNVQIVVKIDELLMTHGSVDDQDDPCQKQGDEDLLVPKPDE